MVTSSKPPSSLRNPKGWTKPSTVRSEKRAIGWIFKQLLGRPAIRPTKRKIGILPPSSIPSSHSVCVPAVSKNFPDRPRLTGSLLQRKCDGTDVFILVCLSLLVWGPSLRSQAQGKLWVKRKVQASTFKWWVSLSTEYPGKAIFFQGRKGNNRECIFRTLSCRNCLASKMWKLHACPKT